MTHSHKESDLRVCITYLGEESSEAVYAGKVQTYLPPFLKDARLNKYIAWDSQGTDKKKIFLRELSFNSSFMAASYFNREPLAFAWGKAIGLKTCEIHFGIARYGSVPVHEAAKILLADLGEFYQSLICMIPAPFRGARRFANSLGFEHKFSLKKACWLAHWGKYADGEVYLKE